MKVIKLYEERKAFNFIEAYASQSRYMGVIGVRMHFEDTVLFFHLDYEEYGMDRFEAYSESDLTMIDQITDSFMGGLGEPLVQVTYEEACFYIHKAIDVGSEYDYEVPLDYYLYEERIETLDDPVDQKKICKTLQSKEELIHYFFMRVAGCDQEILPLLSEVSYSLHDQPTVLLKNEICKVDDHYIVKSFIDYENAYKLYVSKVYVDGIIKSCELLETLDLSAKEAAFQLNKKEYLTVLYNRDTMFEYNLQLDFKGLLKNFYDAGNLYTLFNQNNDHVNQEVYYLNGDIDTIIYITNHHIVLSSFDEKCLIRTKEKILAYGLSHIADLEAENPIIYSFVNSGLNDFFEFLGE